MQRYMCTHTFGPNAITREQIQQVANAIQQSPEVQSIESFINLSEGKAVCILESPDKGTLADVFKKIGMPVDSITAVEVEGQRAVLHDVSQQPAAGMQA
jgi:Nickel responsive protein SCO4226-like